MNRVTAFFAGLIAGSGLMVVLGASEPAPQATFTYCSGSADGYMNGTANKPALQGLTERYNVNLYGDLSVRLTCS